MKKKGLGKGMGAILVDATIDPSPSDFEYLPLHRIEPNKDQPRKRFEQEHIDELTESIREHGLLSPLMVRAVDGGFYQIIAGERRWRAAREAGLVEVPARVVVADDKRTLELALVENIQREDLSPIEEARSYKALMESFDMTQEEVALRVSKSRPSVANAIRLLSLPDELTELVLRSELSAGSARALLGLKDEAMMKEAARQAVKEGMSVREVETLVRRLERERKEQPAEPKKQGLQVDYMLEAKNKLTKALGRKVNVKQAKGKGKIEIEYYDLDDFNVLFEELLMKVAQENYDNDEVDKHA
ncbi:MAG: ParB/RepB/Spo0J family partition protein [Oscillospiraceae bacterium]|nr:ParB/RepB/Spo0J family partition protein [Oscillospiraceae bacterium]